MPLAIAGLVLLLISVLCLFFILAHAFRRSVGTGFMVLCIPFYALFYAFSQFEHPRKNLIIAGWLGLGVPGALLLLASVSAASGAPGGGPA